jgi:antitoxin ParD1/3/4
VACSEQSIRLTSAALAFVRELVESGEYPDVPTAVSEELIKAHGAREREQVLQKAKIQRRPAAYRDTWEPNLVSDSFSTDDPARCTHCAQRHSCLS